MTTQTIQFDAPSISEIGSGGIAAYLFSGTTLSATLASVTENATLNGRYTGTVADVAAGNYRLVVKFSGYTVSEPDYVVDLLLAVATYVAYQAAVLASSTLTQINAEVLDVLNVDTFAEETGAPAATSSLRKKIGWMFMWFRNKVTQTGTTSTLFADDGTTPVGTHTVSDDATTFTSGEGV